MSNIIIHLKGKSDRYSYVVWYIFVRSFNRTLET